MRRPSLALQLIAFALLAASPRCARADTDLLCPDRPIPPQGSASLRGPARVDNALPTPAHAPAVPAGVSVETATWRLLPALPGVEATPIYDGRRDQLLVAGGILPSGGATSDVWRLPLGGPGTWAPLAAAGTAPPPRLDGIAFYDSLRDRILVFSGLGGDTSLAVIHALSLSGTPTWQSIPVAGTAPASRQGAAAIYDPVRDRLVMFGGARYDPAPPYDTWFSEVWALSLSGAMTWTNLTPAVSGPMPRFNATALYDPDNDRMVIYGGAGAAPNYVLGDLWQLSLSGAPAWTPISPSGTPPTARSTPAFLYDPIGRRALLCGGQTSGYPVSDLWSLSLSGAPAWVQLAPGGGPPPDRTEPRMTYDWARTRVLLFGGGSGAARADLWALGLDPSPAWSLLQATDTQIPARYATTPFFDPARHCVMTFGGVYTYQFNYDYYYPAHDDAASLGSADLPLWNVVSPEGAGPAARWNHTTMLDPVGDRMIVYGGRNYGGPAFTGVSSLDLASGVWSQPAVGGVVPLDRFGHSAIYDPLRNRMLVYGGLVSTPDTVTSDVLSLSLGDPMMWTVLATSGPRPPARFFHSAIYDPDHDRMIVYGGRNASAGLGDAWALSLADPPTWTPLAPSGGGPGVRYYHSACFDSNRRRMLLFGGKSFPTVVDPHNDTWALSLGSSPAWTYITPQDVAPDPRYAAGIAYDPDRDEMVVLWGTTGYCATGLLTDVWRLAFGSPTPTLISLVTAAAAPDRVSLSWYAAGAAGVDYTVYRRDAASDWTRVGGATGSGTGAIDYVDGTVVSGARYAYRLGWPAQGGEQFSSEVWVDVPASFALSLDPPRPNPGPGDLTVAFSLPECGHASIDVLDIAGRRVMSRDVSAFAAGSHVVRLANSELPSGIYLVRLRQGARQLIARACVMR